MAKLYSKKLAYGLTPGLINLGLPEAKIASRAPTINDRYDKGQIFVDESAGTAYILAQYVAGQPVWIQIDNTSITGIEWTVTAANNVQATNNHGYIVSGNPPIITLPVVSSVGNVIKVIGAGGFRWEIHCNATQQIRFAGRVCPVAAAPGLTAVHSWNTLTLVTRTANTIFEVMDTNDNLILAA